MQGHELLAPLWRRRWLLFVTFLVCTAIGFATSSSLPHVYVAGARILLVDPAQALAVGTDVQSQDRWLLSMGSRVTLDSTLQDAAAILRRSGRSPRLLSTITVGTDEELYEITVAARGPTGEAAADTANAVVEAFRAAEGRAARHQTSESVEQLRFTLRELEEVINHATARLLAGDQQDPAAQDPVAIAELNAAISQRLTVQTELADIMGTAALVGSGIEFVESAVPPAEPVAPYPLRDGFLAGTLALLAVAGVLLFQEQRVRRARDRQDPAAVLEAPLLGEIPFLPSLASTAGEPQKETADPFRFVVAALRRVVGDCDSTVLFTAATTGAGTTSVARFVASAAGHDRWDAVLAEADGHGSEPRSGWRERLAILPWLLPKAPEPPVRPQDPNLSGFARVRISGDGNGVAPESEELRRAVSSLRDANRLVVLDAPPLLQQSETSVLATASDGIVVVATPETRLRDLSEIRQRLEFLGIGLLGYVYNHPSRRQA